MTLGNSLASFGAVRKHIELVDGWLSDGEAKYLYSLARFGPGQGSIVEIGSWKGKSTIVLAAGSTISRRENIYAVDPHRGGPDQESLGLMNIDTEPEFRANIAAAGVESQVIPIVKGSTDAARDWRGPIRLLWIDGDHSYEAVKSDFLLWEPFVVQGGIIAFHDTYAWEGPRRLVEERFISSGDFTPIGFVDTITAVRKQPLSFKAKWKLHALLAVRRIYLMGREHKLPGEVRKWSKAVLRAMSAIR